MSVRNKGESDPNWCSPRYVLDVIESFAPIDLDPCSNEFSKVNAAVTVSPPDDGLSVPWHKYKHVFVNPPYSHGQTKLWTAKAEHEFHQGAMHITMLINASVETKPWQEHVWGSACAVAFWKERIKFDRPDGGTSSQLPSALVYYGAEPERFAEHYRDYATVMKDWST